MAAPTDKGKGKEMNVLEATSTVTAKEEPETSNGTLTAPPKTSTSTLTATPTTPVIGGSRGDWTAVWNAELVLFLFIYVAALYDFFYGDSRNAYYFWNKKTNLTSWENPFEKASSASETRPIPEIAIQAGSTAERPENPSISIPISSRSPSHIPNSTTIGAITPEPTKEDYGGIDPDLAYLDPGLLARRPGAAGGNIYTARFNARSGRFEGDPNRTPDHVSDVSRAKRQNNFYCAFQRLRLITLLKLDYSRL